MILRLFGDRYWVSSGDERDVAQVGDAGCGCGAGVGCSAVVAADLPGLHLPDGVPDPGADAAVDGVEFFLPVGDLAVDGLRNEMIMSGTP